ncbi:sugar ABC transporter substrate-binding protein [Actinoplanes solisilvae]|uniref:sugar ABC transporter substrate-binding protein n=1 Tax=Actinoplanes solisilvae TaxID=2486853 RepID=UPI000FD8DA79|nr:substrate-binding domain-containing protein [Actinoplanes solisilvae]
MRKRLLAIAAVGLMATATMTACDDSGDSGDTGNDSGSTSTGSGKARVGVIFPDTESSTRWANEDPKYLEAALKAAKIPVEMQNANGDRAKFVQIGESMINSGVKVLIIANLDSVSGKAVLDKARAKKVPTIDYDRLTLNGGADYYVSFDGNEVGRQQAWGLIKCLKAKKAENPLIAQLNGSPADNNATLFKAGYDEPLNEKYDEATYRKGPEQWVPEWKDDEAEKIFTQMLGQAPDIRGVLAANDGMGNAVIKVLRKHKLNGVVPVTGQDATLEGLQNILTGEQCMTVYKAVKAEATAAANLAIELFNGKKPEVGPTIKDPESGAYVPFESLKPTSIFRENINDVVPSFVPENKLCVGKYLALCKQYKVGSYAKAKSSDDDEQQ